MKAEHIKKYVVAGNSTFTLKNPQTGNRFTYKVKKARKYNNTYYVKVLWGPDNYSNYIYIGKIQNGKFKSFQFHQTRVKAFAWFWGRLHTTGDYSPAEFYHSGKCGRCGRKLTVPESIRTGIGPECESKMMFSGLM